MPDDPYRPTPAEPDAELARLAAEGHKRREHAQADHAAQFQDEESKNIRAAIGGTRWSTPRLALIGLGALGAIMAFVPSVLSSGLMEVQIVGIFLFIGALAVGSIMGKGLASGAQVEAERRWGTTRPFALVGYFDVLAGAPDIRTRIVATLEWGSPSSVPDSALLRDVVAAHDAGAEVEARDSTTVLVTSSSQKTRTDVRVNKTDWISTNAPFVPYVHGLVDRVLCPLHQKHPLKSVTLAVTFPPSAPC